MKTIILGGGYAGTIAAARVKGHAVTLVNAKPLMEEKIRLHQRMVGNHSAERSFDLLRRAGVEVVIGTATQWLPNDRCVIVDGRELRYDNIIYALGARTTLEDARAQKCVTVAGAGLTGIEVAAELAEAGHQVELLSAGPVGPFLSESARAHVRKVFTRLGVTLRENVHATHADIWTNGFAASPLAREAGLLVNDRGQLLVDAHLRVPGRPEIFAVGDAAATGLAMGCKTAMPTGAYAADVLCGRTTAQFAFADSVYCVSLGRHDGVVQFLAPNGALRDKLWTGHWAAFVKERICRYTRWAWQLEAMGIMHYRWPQHG